MFYRFSRLNSYKIYNLARKTKFFRGEACSHETCIASVLFPFWISLIDDEIAFYREHADFSKGWNSPRDTLMRNVGWLTVKVHRVVIT